LCVFQSSLKHPLYAMVGKVGAGVVFLLVCAGPLLECGASHTDDIVWEEAPELQFVQAEEAHWHKVAKFLPSFNESPTAMPESEVDDFELLLQRPSLRARLLSKAKIAGKAAGAAAAGAGGNAKQIKKAVKHAAKSAAWLAWVRHTKKKAHDASQMAFKAAKKKGLSAAAQKKAAAQAATAAVLHEFRRARSRKANAKRLPHRLKDVVKKLAKHVANYDKAIAGKPLTHAAAVQAARAAALVGKQMDRRSARAKKKGRAAAKAASEKARKQGKKLSRKKHAMLKKMHAMKLAARKKAHDVRAATAKALKVLKKHVKNAKAKAKAMAHKATKGALKKLKKSVAKAHAKIAAVKKKAAARMKKAKKAKAKSKAMKKKAKKAKAAAKKKFKKVKKAAKKAAKKAGKKLKKKAKKAKKKAAKKAKKKLKKAKKKTKKVLKKKKKQIKKQKKKVKKMTAKQRRLHARHVGKARAHARFHKLYKKYGMHHSAKRHAALAKKHRALAKKIAKKHHVAPAEDLFDTWGMNRKHINHKVADAVSTVAEEAAQVNRIALNLVQVAKIKAQKLKEARKIVMQREASAHQAVIMASHAMKLAQKTKGEALAAAKRATRVMASHH